VTLLYPVVPDGSTPPSDAELMLAVRAGDRHAYGTLYERHLAAARVHARQLTRSSADADDLVAEAFAKIFTILQAGHGPDNAFRAYLLATVRNGFYQRMRQDRRLELTDDMTRHDEGVPWSDPVEAELNSGLAARAFSALPARWQTVLWQSEVERLSAAEIGERLGLRPSAVAALAYRAREGLRQAYLQAHLAEHPDENCRPTVRRLGGWTRGKLAAGDAALVREHLDDCDRCRRLAAELADVNDGIRGLLVPLAVAGSYASSAVGAASVGVAASGPAVGGTVASGAAAGGGSVIGSALGWLLGAQAGPAVAVLTAVVVGGTAIAAGTGVLGSGQRAPTAATAAAGGSGRPVAPGDRPDRTDSWRAFSGKKGKPSPGKQPSGPPVSGKGLVVRPSGKQPSGPPVSGEGLVVRPSGKQPSGPPVGGESASVRPSGRQPSGALVSAESASVRPSGKQPSGTPVSGKSLIDKPSGTQPSGESGLGPGAKPLGTPPSGQPAQATADPTHSRTSNGAPIRVMDGKPESPPVRTPST
jgi:RNA polymerase sigma factor (sigma-70 family)